MDQQTGEARDAQGSEWVAFVERLLQWKRFIVLGVAASWALLLLAALAWPRVVDCDATVSLPGVLPRSGAEQRDEDRVGMGLPIASYKRVERILADGALLKGALGSSLPDAGIRALSRNLRQSVIPIGSGARDDLQRLDKQDVIVAVRLTHASSDGELAQRVVESLALLLRRVVIAELALERIHHDQLEASTTWSTSALRLSELDVVNRSLMVQEQDLRRLLAGFPQQGAAPREVVDVGSGGHRYLPPGLQLVGVLAQRADNEHTRRMSDNALQVALLKTAFLTKAAGKLAAGIQGSAPLDDVPAALEADLVAFLSAKKPEHAEQLRASIGGLISGLNAQQSATVFIQSPTLRRRSIAMLVATLALGLAAAFTIAALLASTWARVHAAQGSSRRAGTIVRE